jgi:hypothetical protein
VKTRQVHNQKGALPNDQLKGCYGEANLDGKIPWNKDGGGLRLSRKAISVSINCSSVGPIQEMRRKIDSKMEIKW